MKIKVIVNPKSGRRVVQKELETIIGRLLIRGIAEDVNVTATQGEGDAKEAVQEIREGEYDLIIGCGGDGTINEIVQGLMESGKKIPLAILAAGTSNDFAECLRLPRTAEEFCHMVERGHRQKIDVGCANGHYFINVAAFGMLTEVAHKTPREAKGILGKLAYYLHGMKAVPEQLLKFIPVTVKSKEMELEGDIRLCIIGNSRTVATLPRLLRKASLNDGKFDVFIVRRRTLMYPETDIITYLSNKEMLNDPGTVYFQTDHIEIDSPMAAETELDLDGEYKGSLPLVLDVCHNAVELILPEEDDEKGLFLTEEWN